MQSLVRFFMATLMGLLMAFGLFLLMMALISINKDTLINNSNVLTTQAKVSSSPGVLPATQIVSKNQNKSHQLPVDNQIKLPNDSKALLTAMIAKQSGDNHIKSFAAPSSHNTAAKPGSQSQALVKVSGLFNVIGPDPRYPETALSAGQEGWVETLIHLNKDGSVNQVEIIKASPAGIFELSVVTAVREWIIKPNDIHGNEISNEYFHRFEFNIDR